MAGYIWISPNHGVCGSKICLLGNSGCLVGECRQIEDGFSGLRAHDILGSKSSLVKLSHVLNLNWVSTSDIHIIIDCELSRFELFNTKKVSSESKGFLFIIIVLLSSEAYFSVSAEYIGDHLKLIEAS